MAWKKRLSLVLLFFLLGILTTIAQNASVVHANDPAPAPKIENKHWEQSIENIDYGKVKKPAKIKEIDPHSTNANSTYSTHFGIEKLILATVIAILVIITILLLYQYFRTRNTPIAEVTKVREILKDDDIENIKQDELSNYLNHALANSDFRLAVRIKYLIILRQMADAGWIVVKREKTNYDYLRELKTRNEQHAFKEVTLTYEFIWYGDIDVSKNEFSQINHSFENLLTSIHHE